MNSDGEKIVNFREYCPKCEHYPKEENEDPCWKCLIHMTNTWSHKPLYFEKKKK